MTQGVTSKKNDNQGPVKSRNSSVAAYEGNDRADMVGSGSVMKRAVHGTRPFPGDVKRGKG